ncbi:hypothetical protein WH297_25420 [Ochrobactrum vermis]|uniref:Uncharacterized protein n=1 Tax=Ochrobactrum vermis TaxID=1827297 RepID=A0ABU8PLC3_9HYPH|nr:hypothetical protein [Ochrobactrum vermis]PQZ24423.1 hypothetical protein CQZ93_25770 [Ochrobactrum vermis]
MGGFANSVHPQRVAACFGAGGSGIFVKKLMQESRFTGRLEALLRQHYHLEETDGAGDPVDRALAALSLSELEALAFRAGIIFRARVFIQEIRGPVLAAFAARFGDEALEDARLHHDLAGERALIHDLDALEKAIRDEGRACLAACIATLPEPLSKQLCLKWPDDASIPSTSDPDILEHGPAIVRRLGEKIGQAS